MMLDSVKKRSLHLVFEIRLSLKQNQNDLKLKAIYISIINKCSKKLKYFTVEILWVLLKIEYHIHTPKYMITLLCIR